MVEAEEGSGEKGRSRWVPGRSDSALVRLFACLAVFGVLYIYRCACTMLLSPTFVFSLITETTGGFSHVSAALGKPLTGRAQASSRRSSAHPHSEG